MNRKILSVFSLLILLVSCSKEDALEATNYDKNWLIVADSEHPIDHHIYQLYEKTGIPIFYHDSIGTEERVTLSGNKYTHIERLKVFYKPGIANPNPVVVGFTLVEDKNELKSILDFLENNLLPKMPNTFYFPSILLTKTLKSPSSATLYVGFNTILISKVLEYPTMTEADKIDYEYELISALVINNLMELEKDWLLKFKKNTIEKASGLDVYTGDTEPSYGTLNSKYCTKHPSKPTATYALYQSLGFINEGGKGVSNIDRPTALRMPKIGEDIGMYIEACLKSSEEDFTNKFKSIPVIMAKYKAIRLKLKELKFDVK